MNDATINRVIDRVYENDDPYCVYIRYRGCGRQYLTARDGSRSRVVVYHFFISGGQDYIFSVGTQARYGRSNDDCQTIFRLRDAHDGLGGQLVDHRTQHPQWVDMSIRGAWNFHIFQVVLSLGRHVLSRLYQENSFIPPSDR